MTEFQIFTDSCCDLLAEQTAAMNVVCVPLSVVCNGAATDDYATAEARKAFFDTIRAGSMPSTSAVNPDRWMAAFKEALDAGKDVLALCFASALSATYQSAVIAAEELKESYPERTILVCDTVSASAGEALLVYKACKLRDEGKSMEEIHAWLEENKAGCCLQISVDDLSHLKRGGRISATSAIVGSMLNIKPIIHVDNDGHLINTAKVRGRKVAMEYLVKKFTETCTDFDTVFIGHGDCPEDAATLEAMLREAHPIKEVVTGYVGPVIGAHTGPGVLVVFFMGTTR